ncbi:MAG: hypothetical protein E7321_00135 [Clostridiales bacterium]|nr:hypothetical protein [Clostridiales bacterium]
MDKGFDPEIFSAALRRNLARVGVLAFGGMAGVMVFGVVLGMIAMMAGELAVIHLIAMLGMAGGFGVLAALCVALVEGHGGNVFAEEKGEPEHE